MSVWAHIAGVIRYDDIRCLGDQCLNRIKQILGNTCSFEDSEETWDKCNVPCGSEGSLQYSIIENPDQDTLAAYVVPIWGDLRSYEDFDEVRQWFERCIVHKGLMVRQAVLHMKVEGQDSRIWKFCRGKEKVIEIKEFS